MNYSGSASASGVQISSTVSSALRALLNESIDYAGLFPPAKLALEPAIMNYAAYLRSDESWMLSSFVLPATQFSAVTSYFSRFDPQHPLRISALGARTEN